MDYKINHYTEQLHGEITLSSSKSESNRALIINALSGGKLGLSNLSDARDTQTMNRLLTEKPAIWDVLDAGTTMRFCTAYLGINGNGETITGTPRMKERPIGLLVNALRQLGAKVEYLERDGYPPMKIEKVTGTPETNKLSIPGNISSQYISALLMIGPTLPSGIEIELTGPLFSRPYIQMTLNLMKHFGVNHIWEENIIKIAPQDYKENSYTIESDWSGASYWYSMVALNEGATLQLNGLREDSNQGDQEVVDIMSKMGVKTDYNKKGVFLTNMSSYDDEVTINFKTCPDLAQTVLVVAALKGIKLKMTGLESLRIKETDRIEAMQTELKKIGGTLNEYDATWELIPGEVPLEIEPIHTYEDHRMALAFGPVCNHSALVIEDIDVVKKSYPGYWKHLASVGVNLTEC